MHALTLRYSFAFHLLCQMFSEYDTLAPSHVHSPACVCGVKLFEVEVLHKPQTSGGVEWNYVGTSSRDAQSSKAPSPYCTDHCQTTYENLVTIQRALAERDEEESGDALHRRF